MRVRQTSHLAYSTIKNNGLLSKRRWEAYSALYEHGPITANELCQKAGVTGLWKRLSELKQAGLAKEVGQATCAVTGMTATLWDVTDHVPTDYVRPKSNLQLAKERLSEFAEHDCSCPLIVIDKLDLCPRCVARDVLRIMTQKKDVA